MIGCISGKISQLLHPWLGSTTAAEWMLRCGLWCHHIVRSTELSYLIRELAIGGAGDTPTTAAKRSLPAYLRRPDRSCTDLLRQRAGRFRKLHAKRTGKHTSACIELDERGAALASGGQRGNQLAVGLCAVQRNSVAWASDAGSPKKLPELIQRLAKVLLGRTLRFIRPEEHRQPDARTPGD